VETPSVTALTQQRLSSEQQQAFIDSSSQASTKSVCNELTPTNNWSIDARTRDGGGSLKEQKQYSTGATVKLYRNRKNQYRNGKTGKRQVLRRDKSETISVGLRLALVSSKRFQLCRTTRAATAGSC
jgi:hypothetical protein